MLKLLALTTVIVITSSLATPSHALAQPTNTPVTATCKDGSTFSGNSKKGACSHHGGVVTYGAPVATSVASNSGQVPAVSGSDKVWVNTSSKVYHCPGDRYYGKTKNGTYMSASEATRAGDKPADGKFCK
jgi:hypothetical protein